MKPVRSGVHTTDLTEVGLDDHPEKVRLEYAAYDAMSIRPGSRISRLELKRD